MNKIKYIGTVALLIITASIHAQPAVLPAKVDVSAIGAATYTIPIEVVPGTNGLQPNLAIVYNSISGLNIMGQKWGLQGISSITRVPQSVFYDGNTVPVRYDTTDRFALDGKRMILFSGMSYHGSDAVYCSEVEDFSRIRKVETTNDCYFLQTLADGSMIEYGKGLHSQQILNNGKCLSWMVDKVSDVHGNSMEYYYQQNNGEIWIDHIDYTILSDGTPAYATVVFKYVSMAHPNDGFIGGQQVRTSKNLKEIVIKYQNTVVRKYQFGYNSSLQYDRLTSVSLTDASDAPLASTIIDWYSPSSNSLVEDATTALSSGYLVVAGNFDADRLYDVVAVNTTTKSVYLLNGSPDGLISIPHAAGYYLQNQPKAVTCGDFDGDGIDELLYRHSATNQWTAVKFSNGTPVSETQLFCSNNMISFGDFDGDGVVEPISLINPQQLFSYYLDGTSFNNRILDTTYYSYCIGDYTGDGKADMLLYNTTKASIYSYNLHIHEWIDVETFSYPGGLRACLSGDFNGDGMSDVLFLPYSGSSWMIALRKGENSWIYDYLPVLDTQIDPSAGGPKFIPVVSDINGDGKSDILQSRGDGTIRYLISQGCFDNHYQSFSTGSFSQSSWQYLEPGSVTLGDFDGNGIADLFFFNTPPGGHAASIKYFYKGTYPGYMSKRFIDAAGKITKLEYSTISLMPNRYFGAGMNWMPLPLVKNLLVSNGLGSFDTTRYYYGEAQYDADRHQFIGFSLFGMKNNSNVSETFLSRVPRDNNSTFALLMPDSVVNYVVPNTVNMGNACYWSSTTHLVPVTDNMRRTTIVNTNSSNYRTNVSGNISFLPYVSESIEKDFRKNTKTTKTISLGNNWRVEQQETNAGYIWGSSEESSRQMSTYSYVTRTLRNGAQVVKPSQITTTHYNNATTTTPRTDIVTYTYTNYGQPQKITHSDNGGLSITESFVYNSHGLPKAITTSHQGVADSRSVEFNYDPTYRFTLRTTDHAGNVITKTYSPSTGLCLSEIDANNLTTQYEYDGLGRLTLATFPDATTKAVAYANASGVFTDAICHTTVTESGKPEMTIYYDCLGRKIHTSVSGQGYMDFVYDKLGRKLKETLVPYTNLSANSASKKWQYFRYDLFGRVVKDSSYYHKNIYSYGYDNSGYHYTVATTDKRGATASKTFDAAGRVIEVEDAGGTVTYTYDRLSQSGTICDRMQITTGGNTTTILADSRGNRILLSDPDAGTVSCTYDVWGNMLTQTDGKGDVTTMSYDNQDRMVSKTYSLNNSTDSYTYTYGAAAPLKGKLTRVYSNNALSQLIGYDAVGRVSSTTKYINGNAYTHQYTYNSNGQPYTTQYPSGYVLRHEYDTDGRLKCLKNNTNNTIIYSIDRRNAMSQPTLCAFGNGTGVDYTYDFWGLPTQIQYGYKEFPTLPFGFRDDDESDDDELENRDDPVVPADPFFYTVGEQYSVLQYTYDTNGYITRKRDLKTNQQEEYSYDNLGRLVSFTVNGNMVHSFSYEDNGNMGINSLVGSLDYVYGSSRPHAVTEVEDENGRIPATQCDVTYNSRNRPETISENGWSLELVYGSGLQRERSILRNGTTTVSTTYFISKDCEYEIKPTFSRYIDYIYAEGRIVALHVHNITADADSLYYVQTDLLGSWDRVVDGNNQVVQSSHFDPWGNRMSATNWTLAQDGSNFSFRRGFTGHEHYDRFGIINMNARLYDPVIGRFFSPDPQVQNPFSTQGFNRYSYCGNNPVMCVDEDGEFWWLIPVAIGAAVGAFEGYNLAMDNGATGWEMFGYIAGGALVGGISGFAGAAVSTAVAGAIGIGGFAGGVISGAAGGATSGAINGLGTSILSGDSFSESMKNMGIGAIIGMGTGAVVGGLYEGISSAIKGNNFWTGEPKLNTTVVKTPQQLGKEGELAADISAPKDRIESLTGTANYRIPDGIDYEMHILYEVKNVSRLGVTHQLEDFILYCKMNNYYFILYIRNESTLISTPLHNMLETIPHEIRTLGL